VKIGLNIPKFHEVGRLFLGILYKKWRIGWKAANNKYRIQEHSIKIKHQQKH